MSQVRGEVFARTGIPELEQVLLIGRVELSSEDDVLASAMRLAASQDNGQVPGRLPVLQLTLIREEEPPPPQVLQQAIRRGDSDAALELLQRPRLRGLNETDQVGSLLHTAIHRNLIPVALALLERKDFKQVNAKDAVHSWTALHRAACRGLMDVCEAILSRPDFQELRAKNRDGMTAEDVAAAHGHTHVAALLATIRASEAEA